MPADRLIRDDGVWMLRNSFKKNRMVSKNGGGDQTSGQKLSTDSLRNSGKSFYLSSFFARFGSSSTNQSNPISSSPSSGYDSSLCSGQTTSPYSQNKSQSAMNILHKAKDDVSPTITLTNLNLNESILDMYSIPHRLQCYNLSQLQQKRLKKCETPTIKLEQIVPSNEAKETKQKQRKRSLLDSLRRRYQQDETTSTYSSSSDTDEHAATKPTAASFMDTKRNTPSVIENHESLLISTNSNNERRISECFNAPLALKRQPTINQLSSRKCNLSKVKQSKTPATAYLIYGPETKKVTLPEVIRNVRDIKALFHKAFSDSHRNMNLSKSSIVYIKDTKVDIFYELEDIRDLEANKDKDDNQKIVLKLIDLPKLTASRTRIFDDCSRDNPFGNSCYYDDIEPIVAAKAVATSDTAIYGTINDASNERVNGTCCDEYTLMTTSSDYNNLRPKNFFGKFKKEVKSLRHELNCVRMLHRELINEAMVNQYEKQIRSESVQTDMALECCRASFLNIERELEELEELAEETYKDEKSNKSRVNESDIEGLAYALSRVTKSLVETKTTHKMLIKRLGCGTSDTNIRIIQPDQLVLLVKKCKRLASMLYALKRLAIQRNDSTPISRHTVDIRHLPSSTTDLKAIKSAVNQDIRHIVPNSEARLKAQEASLRIRKLRKKYLTCSFDAVSVCNGNGAEQRANRLCRSSPGIDANGSSFALSLLRSYERVRTNGIDDSSMNMATSVSAASSGCPSPHVQTPPPSRFRSVNNILAPVSSAVITDL